MLQVDVEYDNLRSIEGADTAMMYVLFGGVNMYWR
jgi:hypothetical protein